MLYKIFVKEASEFVAVEDCRDGPQIDDSGAMVWRTGDVLVIIGNTYEKLRFQIVKVPGPNMAHKISGFNDARIYVHWSGKNVRQITKGQFAAQLEKANYWSGPKAIDCPEWALSSDNATGQQLKEQLLEELG